MQNHDLTDDHSDLEQDPAELRNDMIWRRETLLAINPHVYYDEQDRYEMTSIVVPTGRWVTLALAVRSFGWAKVERSPEVLRMLDQVPMAAIHYVNRVTAEADRRRIEHEYEVDQQDQA